MLVTVAHGTRNSSGNEVAARITEAAAARLGVPAVTAYVELCDPLLADVMTGLEGPAVVVPFLGLHPAVLVAPPVPGLLGDLQVLTHRGQIAAFTEQPLALTELAKDLLGGVPTSLRHLL